MRIERLHIDGFGVYRDAGFGPFDPALTIVTGLNEAGKSTMLAFIRAVLFGFPARGGAEHYPPLSGGRHGGRVHIVTDGGARFSIERFQGRGGGSVAITAADGSPVDEAMLPGLLGHVSGSLFQAVFAFDLEDLPKTAAGDDQEVSNRIYSAGTGAADLPGVMESLKKRAEDIFAPRGKNQPVAELLRTLGETESAVKAIRTQAADYGHALARREQLTGEVDEYQQQLEASVTRRRELEAFRSAQDDWSALRTIEQRLDVLPDHGSFPDDPIGRLDRFEQQYFERQAIARDATEELDLAQETAERPIDDEPLLSRAVELESLRRGIGGFNSSIRDLPERSAELRAMQAQLDASLRHLGPGWDESRLERFDTSMPRVDAVEQWRQALSERGQTIRDRAATLEIERQEHRDAVEAQAVSRAMLEAASSPSVSTETLEQRGVAMRDARRQESEYARLRQRRVDLELQQSDARSPAGTPSIRSPWAPPLILALAGLVLVVVGIAGGQAVAVVLGAPGNAGAGGSATPGATRGSAPRGGGGAVGFAQPCRRSWSRIGRRFARREPAGRRRCRARRRHEFAHGLERARRATPGCGCGSGATATAPH